VAEGSRKHKAGESRKWQKEAEDRKQQKSEKEVAGWSVF